MSCDDIFCSQIIANQFDTPLRHKLINVNVFDFVNKIDIGFRVVVQKIVEPRKNEVRKSECTCPGGWSKLCV